MYFLDHDETDTTFLIYGNPSHVLGKYRPSRISRLQSKSRVCRNWNFGGSGVRLALEAGFEEVHSCDIDPICIQDAKKDFSKDKRVHVYYKDSSYQLRDIIETIHEPITFWLDAHNGFPDPEAVDVKNSPLMEELDQIKEHPIKSHIILIDDLHCCGTLLFDFLTLDDIIEKVLEVNPYYIITYVDGGDEGEYPNNVLAALPPDHFP